VLCSNSDQAMAAPAVAVGEVWPETREPDLIVMPPYRRTGIARMILGSVAEHAVRETKRPAVTIRSSSRASDSAVV